MPRGLRQVARSSSRLSPMSSSPVARLAMKIASLMRRPVSRFLVLTSFQRRSRPSLSLGSSSLISRLRQSLSVSFCRLRPPGNIQRPSRRRRTRRTRPRFAATSLDDFAISCAYHLTKESKKFYSVFFAIQERAGSSQGLCEPPGSKIEHCPPFGRNACRWFRSGRPEDRARDHGLLGGLHAARA